MFPLRIRYLKVYEAIANRRRADAIIEKINEAAQSRFVVGKKNGYANMTY